MESPKFLWIQTRDGSPTLWSNELGESFRSVKGAFIESWEAFIQPALAFAPTVPESSRPLTVGEFGLGPGTNWILWHIALAAIGRHSRYFVIERDRESFELGRARWVAERERLVAFVSERLALLGHDPELITNRLTSFNPADLAAPLVFADLDEAMEQAPRLGLKADIWFHDPFGFDVNPEGYSDQTLHRCSSLWQPTVWGGSYACNRRFREALASLPGVEAKPTLTGDTRLKRERLEFYRRA